MNADTFSPVRHSFEQAVDRLVREHNLAVENLTERQLVDLLKQMIAAGDIVRYVVQEPGCEQKQCMVYQPFREVERLKARNADLERALRWALPKLERKGSTWYLTSLRDAIKVAWPEEQR